jgi:glycosyltransferase involved in cell wall biosynthesis
MASPALTGVSVVIPTIDREDRLAAALAAIARAALLVDEPVEAIVVDDRAPSALDTDGDRDGDRERVLDGLHVRWLRTRDAGVQGPAAARNLGVAAAEHDLIAFTDDDARCDERWLQTAVRRLRAEPGIAGVEGAVRVDLEAPVDPVRSRIVMNAHGGGYLTASMFARADAIRAVGGFRRLRTDGDGWAIPYREDSDLALRIIRDVGPIPFEPEAFVVHPAEPVDLRRLIQLARHFVVDGAFARLHPGAVPSLRRRPLARLRIRCATVLTLLTPGLARRRTRRAVALMIVALGAAVSAQFEVEIRAGGAHRGLVSTVLDTVRRLPRALLWSLVAGSSRLQGEAMVRLGLILIPSNPSGSAGPPR